jgi:peptide deformylase
MALRTIRKDDDEILRKKSKKVDEISDRVRTLIKDMIETMYAADGIGLAAPQVGILKRIAVVDVGNGPVTVINPEIVNTVGTCVDVEGCLSLPGRQGEVERPEKITVQALNEKGEEVVIEAEGLLARALCHEIDHLNGILFTDRLIGNEEV